jgi:hypothetical protein
MFKRQLEAHEDTARALREAVFERERAARSIPPNTCSDLPNDEQMQANIVAEWYFRLQCGMANWILPLFIAILRSIYDRVGENQEPIRDTVHYCYPNGRKRDTAQFLHGPWDAFTVLRFVGSHSAVKMCKALSTWHNYIWANQLDRCIRLFHRAFPEELCLPDTRRLDIRNMMRRVLDCTCLTLRGNMP